MKYLFYTLLGLTMTFLNALLIQAYWSWFIVSQFDVVSLTLKQALGASFMLGLALSNIALMIKTKDMEIEAIMWTSVWMLAFNALSGFLWHVIVF